MNGFGNKLLLVLPVLMLLAPAGYAAYDTPAGLLAAYENMKCKTDFTIDLIEDMADKIPEAEYLTEYSDALDSHMDELKSLAEDGDKRAYRSYMSENLRPAFTDAKEGIREARGNFREWNVSLETKLDLLDTYIELNETFWACDYSTLQDLGDERVASMKDALDRYEDKEQSLSDRGVDTTQMKSAIDDAESEVIVPLERELGAAGTSAELRDALKSYCLGNGCVDGVNAHFFADVEVAKLNAVLDFLEPDAEEAGLSHLVEEARGYLDTAQRVLDVVGDELYAEGESEEIWDNIHDGADTLTELLRSLRE